MESEIHTKCHSKYPIYNTKYTTSLCVSAPLSLCSCLLIRDTLHTSRDTNLRHSTSVEKPLQISPFLTNKPNSPIVQLDVTSFKTMNYMIFPSLIKVKNKPNSNPNKPNLSPVSCLLCSIFSKQTQNKPKFYPLVYPRVLLPRLAAGEFGLTLLWSLPSGVLTCCSAGGRRQSQFVKIMIPLTMAYLAAIFDFQGFFVVKVYKDTGRLKVVVEGTTAGLFDFVNLAQRKSVLYYLGKLFLPAPAVAMI
jgi:hypothetical protein